MGGVGSAISYIRARKRMPLLFHDLRKALEELGYRLLGSDEREPREVGYQSGNEPEYNG